MGVLALAHAVAAELKDYSARVEFTPEFELRELEDLKVCVVPLAVEYKDASRVAREETLKVQVGFLKRATEDDLETLLPQVEKLGLAFLGKTLAKARCIGVAYNPIYSPEQLREERRFTSVIELTFKIVS